jgi:hypothetical protein
MRSRRPSRGRGIDARGRSKKPERYLQLSHFMLTSAAWKSLDPVARALFVELAQRYNGFNNGHIGLGLREAARALKVKPHTVGKAFAALQDRGFVAMTQDSGFDHKRLAREWRITIFPTGDCRAPTAPPTHDYVHWLPDSEKQKPVPFGDAHSAVSGHANGAASQAASNTVAPNGTIGPRSGVP